MSQVDFMNIPQELRGYHQWVLWKLEDRGGKAAKRPYQVNGRPAKPNDPSTWSSFEEVFQVHAKGGYDGIGFVFSEKDPYIGVDLDKVINADTGEIDPRAQQIIDRLDSYTEYSPSKTGYHIIVKGKLPAGGNRKGFIEMYDHGRYFTMTGQVERSRPIEDRQEAINHIHREYISPQKQQPADGKIVLSWENDLTDEEIIERAGKAKGGKRLKELMAGDWSNYDSQSNADLALCNFLARLTGKNPEKMDSIFRKSGLYREKWDERHSGDGRTYGEMTIQKAIDGCNQVYTPKRIEESPERLDKFFIVSKTNERTGVTTERINPSLLILYIKMNYDLKYYLGGFRIYQNNYYAPLESIERIIYNEIPEKFRAYHLAKWTAEALRLENDLQLRDEDLAPKRYINFKNGVLDLETKQLLPHSKELIFVNQIPYNYNPNAPRCELVEKYFSNICNGNPEEINFLFQLIGVILSDIRSFKNWIYLHGLKDTGKSVFIKIIQILLTNDQGERYYSSVSMDSFQEEKPFDVYPALTSKCNLCPETSPEPIMRDTLLKAFTSGGDRVSLPLKYKDPVSGVPRCVLVFAGNDLPPVWSKGNKKALMDRLLVYEFKNPVPEKDRIEDIEKKMNMEYLIAIAIEQLYQFIENRNTFTVPQSVIQGREDLLKESDDIYRFVQENIRLCDEGEGETVALSYLYELFKTWSSNEGLTPSPFHPSAPPRRFNKELKRIIGRERFRRNNMCIVGSDGRKEVTNGFANLDISQAHFEVQITLHKEGKITALPLADTILPKNGRALP